MRYLTTMWVSLVSLVLLTALALVLKFGFGLPLGELLASIGLFLVLVIALVQQIYLRRLEKLNIQIAKIAESLRMDTWLAENIRDFFGISRGDEKRYECVFPVEFSRKPLPLIAAGDYHALQVLTSRLGADHLELNPCLRGYMAKVRRNNNIICVCAPDANPITTNLFNPKNHMPCWIISKAKGAKRLQIKEEGSRKTYLDSPSEPSYKQAKNQNAVQLHNEYMTQKIYEDYGILARLTVGKARYVLIAGLHQPGTWIVAEYLNELLTRQRDKISSVFFESYDFAVVIWGIFDGPRLEVLDKDIYKHYWWQKRAGDWEKVKASTTS